ncbi:MAG: glycoside hydrolase family 43 protein [Actinomycetaceae bacterium]|nr:glycoside hydrolase family 43 protein [Actinomycetaceae bacterium]MDY6082364.1 glycoside hydrolase family 43 protein [Actinomycetaceae bacterium]
MKRKGMAFSALIVMMHMALAGCGADAQPVPSDSVHDGGMMTPQIAAEGADPWIIKEHGIYYYIHIVDDSIVLQSSTNLTDIDGAEPVTIFSNHAELEQLWAPELHFLDEHWYVYFSACTHADDIHRTYVLESSDSHLMSSTWTERPLVGMDDKFAIDATVVANKTGRYLVWSGWQGNENIAQNLYISKMISPLEVEREKILISKPQLSWEKVGTPLVNEGPVAIVHGKTVNIAYSASGSWTDSYCVGLLTAPVDAELDTPEAWIKKAEPIMQMANDVWGPGHNSFVESPDGKETIMVYHAAKFSGAGWDRSVRIQPVEFNSDGSLTRVIPTPSYQLMRVPSGEPRRTRLLATDTSSISKSLTLVDDKRALGGKSVDGLRSYDDAVSWTFSVGAPMRYSIILYASTVVATPGSPALVRYSVDGEASARDFELSRSDFYQPLVLRVPLGEGKHTIMVSANAAHSPVRINRVEIMPITVPDVD